MSERFKEIPGFEGHYMASTLGRIKSLRSGIFMKQKIDKRPGKGYLRVNISVNGKVKTYQVARIIALAFKKNPHSKPTVNHKDGDKTNNNASNLEWATHKEQIIHAQRTGLKPIPVLPIYTRETNPKNKKVLHVNSSGELISEYLSVEFAAKDLNMEAKSIARVCRGERNHYMGKQFKYADNEKS